MTERSSHYLQLDGDKLLLIAGETGMNKTQLFLAAQKMHDGLLGEKGVRRAYQGKATNPEVVHSIINALNDARERKRLARITLDDLRPAPILLTGNSPVLSSPAVLVRDKAQLDFENSCVHDPEILFRANNDGRYRLQLLGENDGISTNGKILDDNWIVIPDSIHANGDGAAPMKPRDAELRAAEPLIRLSEKAPLQINSECIEVACFATWLSLHARYGLQMNLDYRDRSGRQQVLRLNSTGTSDFVITADAPFFLLANGEGKRYKKLTAIHHEDQYVLERRLSEFSAKHKEIFVYAESSASEQLLVAPESSGGRIAHMCESLAELVVRTKEMRTGDRVIAWEPLASGLLQEVNGLEKQSGNFQLWISLLCSDEWLRNKERRELRKALESLFVSEWLYCRNDDAWVDYLLERPWPQVGYDVNEFTSYFLMGSGLVADSSTGSA